jgi:hypothetical protein
MWSRVLGLFEGVIAILIIFGDCWGGFFLFVNLLISGAFDYQDVCTFVQWDVSRQLEVFFNVILSFQDTYSSSVLHLPL